jgi:uncharacterized protein (DUF952 family)
MFSQSGDAAARLVFKIVAADAWRHAVAAGVYRGSTDDQRDGFIHLSTADQVTGTYEKYFRNQNDLLLVAFEEKTLTPHLKWEASRGGALFPHYYGSLSTALACWQMPVDSELTVFNIFSKDRR